jgi:hypothetical protein
MSDGEALRAALREAETAILDVAKLIDPTEAAAIDIEAAGYLVRNGEKWTPWASSVQSSTSLASQSTNSTAPASQAPATMASPSGRGKPRWSASGGGQFTAEPMATLTVSATSATPVRRFPTVLCSAAASGGPTADCPARIRSSATRASATWARRMPTGTSGGTPACPNRISRCFCGAACSSCQGYFASSADSAMTTPASVGFVAPVPPPGRLTRGAKP